MGSVYQARHKDLQKVFALKVIEQHHLLNPDSISRFRIEARALGKLQHPNIVQVTDYGVDPRSGGTSYIVMEYLEGTTLADHLKKKKSLRPEEAFPIAEAVADAVDFAHSYGILHRDLKLQNIFLSGEPSKVQVKILDFGLARIAGEPIREQEKRAFSIHREDNRQPLRDEDETQTLVANDCQSTSGLEPEDMARLTQAGTVMGTPGYIAPEIYGGAEASPASDIFSFGVLLYEMLVGHRPFGKAFSEPLRPSALQPSVPPEMDAVLMGPLELNPLLRPSKCMDTVRLLKRAYSRHRYMAWRAKEWPKRIGFAALITLGMLLLSLFLRQTPFVRNVENSLIDIRFRLLPSRPPDERIVLLSIDEETLQTDPTFLAEKADEMGDRLQGIMKELPIGVGIDLLLPERWNQSRSFTNFVLRNQGKVILATYLTKDGAILGSEPLRGLTMAALGSQEQAERLLGFVNVEQDGDGRIRKASLGLKKKDGAWMLSFPARAFKLMTGRDVPPHLMGKLFRIDYSIDWNKYQRVSWKGLHQILDEKPDFFRGRLVLVGGEYTGSQDYHLIPRLAEGKSGEVSGIVVQALAIDTLLGSRQIREIPAWPVVLYIGAAAMFCISLLLIRRRILTPILFGIVAMVIYLVLSLFLFINQRLLIPAGLPIVLLAIGMIFALISRRRLTFMNREG